MAATFEGKDRVMATAQQIVKSLNTSKDVTEDMILIFSSFDNRLSNITDLMGNASIDDDENCKVDPRFQAAERLILWWDSKGDSSQHPLPWEEAPHEATDYLAAVDAVLMVIEEASGQSDPALMDRSENAIQLAMSKLEDEFRLILIRNTVPLGSEKLHGSIRKVSLSFASNDGEIEEDVESLGEEDQVGGYSHERGGSVGGDESVDLINPDAVNDLREIAERMIRSGYEKECCQVYSSVRRDVLDECMTILGAEKLSIEEVQRIEWKSLDEKMKKWIHAMKIVIRVLLVGEKRLCEQVFGGSELIKEVCFVETAKRCVMQLLNFGKAIGIGKRSAEKLFRVLDMHDVLRNVLPDLQVLFTDETGELMCSDAKGVLDALGMAAIGTFVEFENAVKSEQSRKAIQGGEIHPLTRYVMNYLKLLVDYSDSLNRLLGESEEELDSMKNVRGGDDSDVLNMSPVARRLVSLISCLESNLEEKSKLYEDGAMQYIFLMNNILYLVQKVKDSELRNLLGDDWIRKRRGLIRQYATGYLRAAWSRVLSCLKDEGTGGSSSNASKTVLKERFKNFNAIFEDIYRIQTAWKVPDPQLREELRISISEKVIPAYRSFMGRFGNHLDTGRNSGRYIKYTAEDLEGLLVDLFEGTPLFLHNNIRRKSA